MANDIPQEMGIYGQWFLLATLVGVAGLLVSFFREKIASRFRKIPSERPSEISSEMPNEETLASQVSLALVWFGASGFAMAIAYAVLYETGREITFARNIFGFTAIVGLVGYLAAWVKNIPDAVERTLDPVSKAAEASSTKIWPKLLYLFGFGGTASRLEYWVCQIVTGTAQVICIAFLIDDVELALPWLVILISAVCLLAFGTRRTRDTGVTHWWFLLILVPALNLAVVGFLLFVPTDEFKDRGL